MAFSLPALPYAYDALAPAIDEETMRLHHGIHHAGYTNKLNKAIMGTAYEGQKVDTLLKQLDSLPGNIQADVQNFGGGYANHCLFWQIMGPDEGGTPDGVFADVIHDRFDGFDDKIYVSSDYNSYVFDRWENNNKVVYELDGTRLQVRPANSLEVTRDSITGTLKLKVVDSAFDSDLGRRRVIVGAWDLAKKKCLWSMASASREPKPGGRKFERLQQ